MTKTSRPIIHNRDHRRGGPDAINGRWHYVGATGEPAFQNSWANTGGTYGALRFGLNDDELVIHGNVTGGTSGTVVFTLPADHRPAEDWISNDGITINGDPAQVTVIASTGTVTVTTASGGTVAASDVTVDSTNLVGVGTNVQAVLEELDDAIAAGGAPSTADYLVGTTQAGLSAEIVVGTSPGGELGGTWASPTVDATHSGSSHASVQAAAEATAAAALAAHTGDTTDAHDATAVSFVPAGTIEATNVQAAIEELAGDIIAGGGNGVYQEYTPTWTGASGNPAIGNGTLQAWWTRLGNLVHYYGRMLAGSSTTFGSGNWSMSLPVNNRARDNQMIAGMAFVQEQGGGITPVMCRLDSGSPERFEFRYPATWPNGTSTGLSSTTPFTWGDTDQFSWELTYEAEPPAGPEFVAAGTAADVAADPGDISLGFPAGLQNGDLMIAQLVSRSSGNTLDTIPSGWTLLEGPDTQATTIKQWLYYQFSDGTETGSETWSNSGASLFFGRVYAFRNTALSSFTEASTYGGGTGTTITIPSLTTTDQSRLACAFGFVSLDEAIAAATGETGGDWTEPVAEYTTTTGLNGALFLQTAEMPDADTISGGTITIGSAVWGVRVFALLPLA